MKQQTDFAIVPTQQELGGIQRDLRFFAVSNDKPRKLTCSQIETYNREGYLKGFRIFAEPEIETIRVQFDDLLAGQLAGGKDSYSISTAHLKHTLAYDLLTHPRIAAYVQDLLGPNVIGWGSHFFCKMPHDGKRVSWHQDSSYWPLTPSKTCSVWLAIDAADTGNACMRFLPGLHLHGRITYQKSHPEESNVLDQTVANPGRYGRPVDVELQAGEISIHSDLLLHGSKANDSDRRRCGLTLRYCSADVRAYLGWSEKGVLVAGRDPSGHWANRRRPQ